MNKQTNKNFIYKKNLREKNTNIVSTNPILTWGSCIAQWLRESYVCMKFVPVVLWMEVRLSHVLGNSYTTELSAQAWQCPMGNFCYRKSQQLHFSPGNRDVSSLATQNCVSPECQKLLHHGVQEFLKTRLSPCDGELGGARQLSPVHSRSSWALLPRASLHFLVRKCVYYFLYYSHYNLTSK